MTQNTTIMSTTLLSLLVLLVPLLKKPKLHPTMEMMIMMAFLISLIPTVMTMKITPHCTSINPTLMLTSTLNMSLTISTSMNSNLFLTVALFVTWAIMQFSTWYMKEDPLMDTFKKFLMMFLIAMVVLILAGNLLQLFIGWEGVGIFSFLLINWWYARAHANSSAMQAMTYNRIGDIGIILTIACLTINQSTWEMHCIDPKMKTTLVTVGLILAATGKSAQFFMHMWLPSAMEGPTPVSALLHSSTMVVAGIYLLIQMHPIIENHKTASTACLYLGTTTSLYAAMTALSQNDMKKIIALSTLSQLGLMMTAIGINHPQMAFLHISTHASTKAALFLCAGSLIHNLQNEQDIRKMGNMKTLLPITATSLLIASLTLMGMPLLACFFSKDPIIESACTSKVNTWALITTMMATTSTSAYSLRMIFYTSMKNPRNTSTLTLKETQNQINPIMRLSVMSIFIGFALMAALIQTNAEPSMPAPMKLLPSITMLLGGLLTMEILNKPTYKLHHKNPPLTFLNQLAFFKTTHRWTPKSTLKMSSLIMTQLTDLLWLEKVEPKFMNLVNSNASKLINPLTGLTKSYLMTIAITSTLALISTHNFMH